MKHTVRSIKSLTLAAGILAVALAVSACGAASPAAPKKVTIGILSSNDAAAPNIEGFKAGMTDLGYVEGTNVTYIFTGPIGDVDEQKAYVKSLVDQHVDLIITTGTKASTSAQAAAGETPIVFAPVAFPVDAGLVQSLSKPGGRITGVTNGAGHGRRLQTLLELVPTIKRIYIPMDPNETVSKLALADIQPAADQLGVELVVTEITGQDKLDETMAALPDDVDAIFMLPGSWIADTLPQWISLASEHKLPISSDGSPEAGALFTLDANDYKVGYQAARLADTILKGGNPADLPVETAEFFLTVNLKSAKAVGITIPDGVLARADTIIR